MPDLIVIAFWLFFVLTIVTLVGHGIWVVLAALFGGGKKKPQRYCPHCGRPTAGSERCQHCGRTITGPLADELSDLAAVQRQLQRFRQQGTVKPEVADRLAERVRDYRKQLLVPPKPKPLPRPALVPSPVPSPVLAPVPPAPPVTPLPAMQCSTPVDREEKKPETPPVMPPVTTPVEVVPPRVELFLAAMAAGRTSEVETAGAETGEVAAKPVEDAAKPQAAAVEVKPVPEIPAAIVPPARPKPFVPKPVEPRRSWGEMLAAFMEERNMRWGELVGGLLVVCSYVALVACLWETIKQIPYTPSILFVTTTWAVFGVGLYAHHSWKLAATSQGMLIIATLLVPVNFGIMGWASQHWPSPALLGPIALLAVFAWLVGLAMRVLVPHGRWLAVAGVLGNSAAALAVMPAVGHVSFPTILLALGGGSMALFAGAVGTYLYRTGGLRERVTADQAADLFALLGVTAFAALAAVGFLTVQLTPVYDWADLCPPLALVVAIGALPILAAGLTAQRAKVRQSVDQAYRLAGTTITLVGMAAMLAALVLAWPVPQWIITVAMIDAVVLAAAAFVYRMPILHAGAIAAVTLAYLIGLHLVLGDLVLPSTSEKLLDLTTNARSGTGLAGLFVALAVGSEGLSRIGRRRHARVYMFGAAVMAVAGLSLVTVHGLRNDPGAAPRAAILYLIYGAGCLGLVARWHRTELAYLGLALLAASPGWLMTWHPATQPFGPHWGMLAGIEGLAYAVTSLVLERLRRGRSFRGPLWRLAEILGGLSLVLAAAAGQYTHTPASIVTACCLTSLALLAALRSDSTAWTWCGSVLALVGAVHTLGFNYPEAVPQPWVMAMLGHATAALVGAMAMQRVMVRKLADGTGTVPATLAGGTAKMPAALADSALASSVLALPSLWIGPWGTSLSVAACLTWLAAIWFVLAWRRGDATLFSLHQGVLTGAALAGAAAWLEHAGQIGGAMDIVRDLAALQMCGIAVALLSLAWTGVRIVVARRSRAVLRGFLEPRGGIDRIVFGAVIAGQLLLTVLCLMPEISRELGVVGPTVSGGLGPNARLLAGISAVVLIASLADRFREEELVGTLLLAVTLAGLVAGRFAAAFAVASALRWSLTVVLVATGIALWHRELLLSLCQRLHCRVTVGRDGPRIARGVTVATMALPIIAITVAAAVLRLGGTMPGGPLPGTFFANIGRMWSYLVPLAAVIGVLVAAAIRERSALYAFSAGLTLQLAVALGYALHARPIEPIILLQLLTIVAGGWAIVWLVARRWLDVWRESAKSASAAMLMRVQIGMAALGNLVLIGGAIVNLSLLPADWQKWSIGAGQPLGWVALLLLLVAGRLHGRLRPMLAGAVGMAAIALMASTVRGLDGMAGLNLDPAWGYRTLMLGWAVYALAVVAAAWWVASLRTDADAVGPPQHLLRLAATWVRVAALAAGLLGLKAAVLDVNEQIWAAAAIAVAAGAGATMAVWRRREGWALSAAWGVNLAASIVVWHFETIHGRVFDTWWPRLLQANVIASAAVALIWLAARRRLYQLRELHLGDSPLLAVQVATTLVGSVALAVMPMIALAFHPQGLPEWMMVLGTAPGWIGLILTAAAVAWYKSQVVPGRWLHLLGSLGIAVGATLAATAAPFDPDGTRWLAYHVLLAAWVAAAVAVLAIGWAAERWRRLGPVSAVEVEGWLQTFGSLALLYTVYHGLHDPLRPWRSAGTMLAVAGLAGVYAVWKRRVDYTFATGVLLNLAGVHVWWARVHVEGFAWSPETVVSLIEANVICLAVGSLVWSLIGRFLPRNDAHAADMQSYGRWAAVLGTGIVGLVVVGNLIARLAGEPGVLVGRIDLLALAALAAAAMAGLWHRTSRFAPATLYGLGLTATGMLVCSRAGTTQMICWTASNVLPCFVLAMAGIGELLLASRRRWAAIGITAAVPGPTGDDRRAWFHGAQTSVAAVAGALALWVANDAAFEGLAPIVAHVGLTGRLAGPAGLGTLLAAAVLMAACLRGTARASWQYAAIACTMLTIACGLIVPLDAAAEAVWLHRTIALVVAAAITALGTSAGMRVLVRPGSDWLECCRRSTPVLAGIAVAAILAALGQEAVWFETHKAAIDLTKGGVPLAAWEIAVVGVGMLVMVAMAIAFAVRGDWDPLRQDERKRQVYVYLAEAVLLAIGFHLRYTMPWLFGGNFRHYWMLVVIAVAFVGAGLSEWFRRRQMPVLAQPLERTALLAPIIPAAFFWIMPDPISFLGLWDRTPLVWFFMATFYGTMAIMRRSMLCCVLAALTANIGLWVALFEKNIAFLEHPQIWLIPAALAGLVAEYLNRRRLTPAQSASVRYFALSVIYVSSTADMYIAGLGNNPAWPLVLMVFSVAGVLLGILLRIRSFLYLGVTFLLVDMLSLLCYAARHQPWIWAATGIALGVALIAMFALFEKRRNDVLAAVERFKDWNR